MFITVEGYDNKIKSETHFNVSIPAHFKMVFNFIYIYIFFFTLNHNCISSAHLRNLEPIPHHRANTHPSTLAFIHQISTTTCRLQQDRPCAFPFAVPVNIARCSLVERAQLISQVPLPPARHGSTCHRRTIKHKHESSFMFRTYTVSFLSIHVCVCCVLLMTGL